MYKLEFEALHPVTDSLENKLKGLNAYYDIEADTKDGRSYVANFRSNEVRDTFRTYLKDNGIDSKLV